MLFRIDMLLQKVAAFWSPFETTIETEATQSEYLESDRCLNRIFIGVYSKLNIQICSSIASCIV